MSEIYLNPNTEERFYPWSGRNSYKMSADLPLPLGGADVDVIFPVINNIQLPGLLQFDVGGHPGVIREGNYTVTALLSIVSPTSTPTTGQLSVKARLQSSDIYTNFILDQTQIPIPPLAATTNINLTCSVTTYLAQGQGIKFFASSINGGFNVLAAASILTVSKIN